MTDPMPIPICKLCWEPIDVEKPTERHNGIVCHAWCIERVEEENYDAFITGEHK